MRGDRLDLGRCENISIGVSGLRLTAPTVGVFDITTGAPKDAPPLAGSAALDLFAGKVVTLDVAPDAGDRNTGEPRSADQGGDRAGGALRAQGRRLALTAAVALETPRGRVWLEIDCGSDGDVIVDKPLATALGFDLDKKGRQALSMKLAGGPALLRASKFHAR